MICITDYIHIRKNRISKNGETVFEAPDAPDLHRFLKAAYKAAGISYPKFYKMDGMCKLGFIAAEYLLNRQPLQGLEPDDTGIVLSNAHATLVTDKKHQASIEKGENPASPALFVYTLPNIVTGEISIRHNLKGENAFFITEKFQPEMMAGVINNLILTRKAKAIIAGWIDEAEEDAHAFLYLVIQASGKKEAPEHTAGNVNEIFFDKNLTWKS